MTKNSDKKLDVENNKKQRKNEEGVEHNKRQR